MISGSIEVIQGDTTSIHLIGVEGYSVNEGFSARFVVKAQDETIAIDRQITDTDGGRYRFYLTPTETESLEVGDYTIGIEIRNDTLSPAFVREIHYELRITNQLVF
jgi:hypothetical protein